MPNPSASNLENYLSNIRSAEFVRFTLAFCLLFLVLLWISQELQVTSAYRYYLHEMTVKPSVALIRLVRETENVQAAGYRLVWEDGRLSVLNGCDGIDVMIVLLSALFASSLPWRAKLIGSLMGIALIYTLNLTRISTLYFAFRHDRSLFELIHGVLGPLTIISVVLLFVLFLRNRHEHTATA
jgi:exosortase/archaeosortase family protein